MENLTRTDNVRKNLIFNIIKFGSQLLLQFTLRTVLIYVMGAEYLGLNGLFTNIFSFLNLAELGIGSAIGFSMYKPIAEGDTEKIKSLQSMHKKFYLIIAGVVCVIGFGLLPFLKFFINGEVTVDVNIYILYALYLVYTLVGYFSAHKRSLLFAYQRNDIENKIKTICLFGMTILQIALIFVFENYYIYFSVSIIFTIIECVLIHIVCNKLYPQINGKAQPLPKEDRKIIGKNVAALSFHKIGDAVVYSTDNILISSMFGLTVLGAYSNYYLIFSTLMGVFTLCSNAIKGSVGNLIASKDEKYVYGVYKNINFMFSVFSAFCTICMLVLFQPFISVWTSGNPIYLLDFSTVVLICASFYIARMRLGVGIFKEGAGLFNQDKWKSLVEAGINIAASLLLGKFMGINGVILGTIISTIAAPLWVEPLVLYKHYFKVKVKSYFLVYLRDLIIMVISAAICFVICGLIPTIGLGMLILKFVICIITAGLLLVIMYLPTKDFRNSLNVIKEFIRRNRH